MRSFVGCLAGNYEEILPTLRILFKKYYDIRWDHTVLESKKKKKPARSLSYTESNH